MYFQNRSDFEIGCVLRVGGGAGLRKAVEAKFCGECADRFVFKGRQAAVQCGIGRVGRKVGGVLVHQREQER